MQIGLLENVVGAFYLVIEFSICDIHGILKQRLLKNLGSQLVESLDKYNELVPDEITKDIRLNLSKLIFLWVTSRTKHDTISTNLVKHFARVFRTK